MFLGGPVGVVVGTVVGGSIAKGISSLVFKTKKRDSEETSWEERYMGCLDICLE